MNFLSRKNSRSSRHFFLMSGRWPMAKYVIDSNTAVVSCPANLLIDIVRFGYYDIEKKLRRSDGSRRSVFTKLRDLLEELLISTYKKVFIWSTISSSVNSGSPVFSFSVNKISKISFFRSLDSRCCFLRSLMPRIICSLINLIFFFVRAWAKKLSWVQGYLNNVAKFVNALF